MGGQFITPIDLENNEIYGNLSDHYVAFTGKLSRVRMDFIELVQNNGGQFSSSVTSKTSVLVVGGWNSSNLNGHINSSKYRKAKELSAKGSDIQIVSENAFMNLFD